MQSAVRRGIIATPKVCRAAGNALMVFRAQCELLPGPGIPAPAASGLFSFVADD